MSSFSFTPALTRPARARSLLSSFMASSTAPFVPPLHSEEKGGQMTFTLDPQVAAAMEPLSALAAGMSKPVVGDVASRRVTMEAGQAFMESKRIMPSDVTMTDFEACADDGAAVGLRWYVKDGSSPGSAVLHLHGG